MAIPYNLPADLLRLPLGISLLTLGDPRSTTPNALQNAAALTEVCQIATNLADTELSQSVRCSLVSEEFYAPGHWASVLPNGMGRVVTVFNPVVDVPFAAACPAAQAYPKSWTVFPSGAAWSERRPTGIYGVSSPSSATGGVNSILFAACYMTRWLGRYGEQIAVCYSHGWPHADVLEPALAGSTTLDVDEICGFTGAAATISDGPNAEDVIITSVTQPTPSAYSATSSYFPGNQVTYNGVTYQATMANGPFADSGVQAPAPTSNNSQSPYWGTNLYPSGPGTLNLLTPTVNDHLVTPVLITAIPQGVRWGMALYAKAVVLERGLATVAAPGREGKAVSTSEAIEDATVKAVAALRPFARIV